MSEDHYKRLAAWLCCGFAIPPAALALLFFLGAVLPSSMPTDPADMGAGLKDAAVCTGIAIGLIFVGWRVGRSKGSPMTAPKRRWFRFSLLTMLVVVTIFGCWLGYQVNWIRQRRAIVAQFPKWQAYAGESTGPMQQPSASGSLWLLGERGYAAVSLIVMVNDLDEVMHDSWPSADVKSELELVGQLFPEAL